MNENPYRTPLEMGPVPIPPGRDKFPSITLTEWLVAVAFAGVLFALIAPAEQAHREAKRRSQCLPALNQQQMTEYLRKMRSQQKHDLDSLAELWAERWDMPCLATAPVVTTCVCLIALAGFVVIAALRELWREPASESPAIRPECLPERAAEPLL